MKLIHRETPIQLLSDEDVLDAVEATGLAEERGRPLLVEDLADLSEEALSAAGARESTLRRIRRLLARVDLELLDT